MAVETEEISAENVVETDERVFVTPEERDKIDLITVSEETDLDYILSKVDSIQNPIQNKGEFDPSSGKFPENADSGWLYKITGSGTIDGLTMNPGDVIFAIGDVDDTSSSDMWVKIDNTDSTDILRQNLLNNDTSFTDASDEFIPTQLAVKTYVDNVTDDLNNQLMEEIEAINANVKSTEILVTDWINIEDNDDGSSIMTLPDSITGVIRIYIEKWGDIIKGWSHTPGDAEILFPDDVTHVGKRCLITYVK